MFDALGQALVLMFWLATLGVITLVGLAVYLVYLAIVHLRLV
jgi:hypothetical protein